MKNGMRLDQHPLLYTSGTEFMMPGRLGEKYDVPKWAEEPMYKAALIAQQVYEKFNIKMPSKEELLKRSLERQKERDADLKRVADERRKIELQKAGVDDEDDEDEEDDDEEVLEPGKISCVWRCAIHKLRSPTCYLICPR
jgi:hypothetical protein